MPILFIVGGANGVGKTTWYNLGLEKGYVDKALPFINIDNIQKELGGYTSENALKAETIARTQMGRLIAERKDFMIESNLAKSADYEWIERMRKQNYETSLFFLSTKDAAINKLRVAQRVKEGGHSVPEAIIDHRHVMGLSYLKAKILAFTDVKLIDSSFPAPEVMAVLRAGQILYKEKNTPRWVNDVLYIAERLQQKQQHLLNEQGAGNKSD